MSIVPDRGTACALAFPVRTMTLPGPTVHRVLASCDLTRHGKASLADALLAELATVAGRGYSVIAA